MPAYDFRCDDCGRRVTLRYKTYAGYDNATHTCPHCGSASLTRLISRVTVSRSSSAARFMSDDMGDEQALNAAMDDIGDDPRALGRMLREMRDEVGEDVGPEFDEVVNRLERGDDPAEIESSLPDIPDSPGGDFGGGMDDLL
jgi:putative FmdB family regulatory protein